MEYNLINACNSYNYWRHASYFRSWDETLFIYNIYVNVLLIFTYIHVAHCDLWLLMSSLMVIVQVGHSFYQRKRVFITSIYGVPVTGTFPPGSFHPCAPPRIFSPRKFPPHAKYTIDANLFRLESPILTRAKRATNRNKVRGEVSPQGWKNIGGGKLPWGKNRGGTQGWKVPGRKRPTTATDILIYLKKKKIFILFYLKNKIIWEENRMSYPRPSSYLIALTDKK